MNCAGVISPDAMANSRCLTAPEPADIALDRHVVGRVGEDHLGRLAVHQRGNDVAIEGICRRSADAAQQPDVAGLAAGRRPRPSGGRTSSSGSPGSSGCESLDRGCRSRRSRSRSGSTSKPRSIRAGPCSSIGEDLLVPAGVQRQLVVGQDVGALLRLAQLPGARRARFHCEQLGGLDPAVAGEECCRRRSAPGW